MGASVLRKKVQKAGFGDVKVTNQSIANLADTYDLVVTHRDLTDRARLKTPSALHVSVDDFMNSPRYDEIVELLGQGGTRASAEPPTAEPEAEADGVGADVLAIDSIVLSGRASNAGEAIDEAGRLLVTAGAVEPGYVEAMHEREKSVSTYMGNGLAIPHGTNDAKGPSDAPASRSSGIPNRSTGRGNRPSSSSASRARARTTWRCSAGSRACS